MSESSLHISPQQLIALNEEITTLVRAGVPLELGLRQNANGESRVLARINQELLNNLEGGKTLSDSIGQSFPHLPRVYTAIVDAGIRSGRLPHVLELITKFVRNSLELRQKIEFAFIYPLVVCSIAYALFALFITEGVRRWTSDVYRDLLPQDHVLISALIWLSETSAYWIWIPPLILVSICTWWVWFSRGSFLGNRPSAQRPAQRVEKQNLAVSSRGWLSSVWNFLFGWTQIVHLWHWSNFCELLATLLEHKVPLPEAIRLAADASGSNAVYREMRAVSYELETGTSIATSMSSRTEMPAFIRWSLANAQSEGAPEHALRHAAEIYRKRATFRADVIKMWLPMLLVVFLGGGAVFLYSLSLTIPLRALYMQLDIQATK